MKVYPNKVPRITATLGVVPGYDNESQGNTPSENIVLTRIQRISEEYFKETGRYSSFVGCFCRLSRRYPYQPGDFEADFR